MSGNASNVLVFGPTGAVGSASAMEARRRGATVWLGMRDPNKEIPEIGSGKGTTSDPGFHRVQADLSKPDSVRVAAEQSGAKAAFVYCVFGQTDSMAASFEALKKAGVAFVVLLSSCTVQGDAGNEANKGDFLQEQHAQVEVALRNSGIEYLAVRAGLFNSNLLWYKAGIQKGEAHVPHSAAVLDYLAPEDIGKVCGALLVQGSASSDDVENNAIYLDGPDLMAQENAMAVVGRVLGHQIHVKDLDEEAFVKSGHMPEFVLQSVMHLTRQRLDPAFHSNHEVNAKNIQKYSGHKPTKLEDWVRIHKEEFV